MGPDLIGDHQAVVMDLGALAKFWGGRFKASGLPELEGTEKQVKWANDIRQQMLDAYGEWYDQALGKLQDPSAKSPTTIRQKNMEALQYLDRGKAHYPYPDDYSFIKGGAKDWRDYDVQNAVDYFDGAKRSEAKSWADNVERKYMHSNGIDSIDTSTREGRMEETRISRGNYYRYLNDTVKNTFRNSLKAGDWIDWKKR